MNKALFCKCVSSLCMSFLLQVRIHAYRERTPNVYAECIVNVEVTRNPNDPTILHGDLVLNISETIDPREVISKINATDPDRVSSFSTPNKISPSETLPFL